MVEVVVTVERVGVVVLAVVEEVVAGVPVVIVVAGLVVVLEVVAGVSVVIAVTGLAVVLEVLAGIPVVIVVAGLAVVLEVVAGVPVVSVRQSTFVAKLHVDVNVSKANPGPQGVRKAPPLAQL